MNTLLVARLLGVAGFGRFTVFFLTMHLCWQIASCFDTVYVNYARRHDDPQDKRRHLGAMLLLKGIYVVSILAAFWPLSEFLAAHVLANPSLRPTLAWGMVAGCGLTFYYSLASWHQEGERFWLFALTRAVFPLGVMAVLALLLVSRGTAAQETIYAVYTFAALGVGLCSLSLLVWRMHATLSSVSAAMRRIFWLSKWILVVNATYFLFLKIDVFLLSRLGDGTSLGAYAAAAQLATAQGMITGSLSSVLLPAAAGAVRDRAGFLDFFRGAGRVLAGMEILLLAIVLLAPWIMVTLYGHSFTGGSTALRILTLGWMFQAAHLPFQLVYLVMERPVPRLVLEAGRLLLAAMLLFWLAPSHPVAGTAWSITISTAVFTVVSAWLALRLTDSSLRQGMGGMPQERSA